MTIRRPDIVQQVIWAEGTDLENIKQFVQTYHFQIACNIKTEDGFVPKVRIV